MLTRTMFALLASGTVLAAPAGAAQRWGYERVPDAGACFYQQPNYQGRYFCASAGADMSVIPNGFNDRIRSIRVFGGGQVIVYSNSRYGGAERWIDYSVPDLRREGWDDRISSARLSWQPRYSNEDRGRDRSRYSNQDGSYDTRPRGTSGYADGRGRDRNNALTRDQAQALVRSAYMNVLGREPDPASASWVDHVLNEHWSQQQLENELRKSAEYRQKHPRG